MPNRLYKGFSSHEFPRKKSFNIYDIDLVKMDLLNHIYTLKGERVMMPKFGTIIPELIYEPLDEVTVETLEDELRTVFEFDPRVELLDLTTTVDFDRHSVLASALLRYIELNMTDRFELNIVFEA